MSLRHVAPAALALALLAGCGGPDVGDLQSYLSKHHQYDHDYDVLNGATYVIDGNDVTVKTTATYQATAAQDACGWVSEWLYDGSRDGAIRVLASNGDVLSQRRAEADVCSFG